MECPIKLAGYIDPDYYKKLHQYPRLNRLNSVATPWSLILPHLTFNSLLLFLVIDIYILELFSNRHLCIRAI